MLVKVIINKFSIKQVVIKQELYQKNNKCSNRECFKLFNDCCSVYEQTLIIIVVFMSNRLHKTKKLLLTS